MQCRVMKYVSVNGERGGFVFMILDELLKMSAIGISNGMGSLIYLLELICESVLFV